MHRSAFTHFLLGNGGKEFRTKIVSAFAHWPQALRTMGMTDLAYWSSWGAWEVTLAFIQGHLVAIFGACVHVCVCGRVVTMLSFGACVHVYVCGLGVTMLSFGACVHARVCVGWGITI